MGVTELPVAVHDFTGGLSNDDETHDDRLLGSPVFQKIVFMQPADEADGFACSLLNVVEVVRQPIFVHTGFASASTSALNFGGRSVGVSTSTFTPNSDSSSACNPPQVEQGCTGKSIHQQIEIAALLVCAMKD